MSTRTTSSAVLRRSCSTATSDEKAMCGVMTTPGCLRGCAGDLGLVFQDVEASSAEPTVAQGFDQGGGVDERSAARGHQQRPRRQERQLAGAD